MLECSPHVLCAMELIDVSWEDNLSFFTAVLSGDADKGSARID